MRSIALFCGALPLVVLPQWTQIHPDVWNGIGDPTFRTTIMTAPNAGFHSLSVYYSQSSGGAYSIHRTDDDWDSDTLLCSESYLITPQARELTKASATAMFHIHDFGPDMVRYLSTEEQQTTGLLLDYSIVGPLAVVDDTVCYWMALNEWTSSDTIRVMRSHAHMAGNELPVELASVHVPLQGRPALAFRDQANGVMAVQDTMLSTNIFVTANGGHDWDLRLNQSGSLIHDLSYLDDTTIWAVGDGGLVLRSEDGGLNWEELDLPLSNDLWSVSGYAADSLWISGSDGLVKATGDGGNSWVDKSIPGNTIRKIQALSGAVYAYNSTDLLYRYDPTTGSNEFPAERGPWWSPSSTGVTIHLESGGSLRRVVLFDPTGRCASAASADPVVDMRHLPSGIYVLDVESNTCHQRARFLWLSADP